MVLHGIMCGVFFFLGGGPFYYLEKCSSTFAGPFKSINSIINSTPIAEFKVKFENTLSLSFFFLKESLKHFTVYIFLIKQLYFLCILIFYFHVLCISFWWKISSSVNCRLLGTEWTGAASLWRRVVLWSGSNATERWMCSSQSNKCDKIDLNLSVTWSVGLFWKLRRLVRIY